MNQKDLRICKSDCLHFSDRFSSEYLGWCEHFQEVIEIGISYVVCGSYSEEKTLNLFGDKNDNKH